MLNNVKNKLLTIKEASEMLRVSKITLRRWEKKGIIKTERIGVRHDRRFKLADIRKILSNYDKAESCTATC